MNMQNQPLGPRGSDFSRSIRIIALFAGILTALTSAAPTRSQSAPSWLPDSYYPDWESAQPTEVLTIEHDPDLTDAENGDLLEDALESLQAGQRLEIGGGHYVVDAKLKIDVQGTVTDPIWIVAADFGDKPIITRSNDNENTVNIGDSSTATYLALRGLEITGGDDLIKIRYASNVWIDQCHIHHGAGVGIAANSGDTDHLFITRNEIHHPGGPEDVGEGMYIGGNNASVISQYAIIALNHVHDTSAARQGDGIEVKQGSHHNWIVENWIHDTKYPGILVYGTGGNDINVIERNLVYRSDDNTMQVQGEALVRNNFILAGDNGFYSHDHQGQTVNLTVVHNTIINEDGRGARLNDWTDRDGMIFANNVVYSRFSDAIYFSGGDSGVEVSGNVIYGDTAGVIDGFVLGNGLSDFVNVSWDASNLDGHPSDGSAILGQGDPAFSVEEDISGNTRSMPLDSGAFDHEALGFLFGDSFESGSTSGWSVTLP